MELKTIQIPMNREKGHAFNQLTLDDDVNIPESKPDVAKVIREKGTVIVEEVKVTSGHVFLKGYVEFELLYSVEKVPGGLNNLFGKIPFGESMVLEACEENDDVKVKGNLEDLTITIVNSRKLSVNALLELTAVLDDNGEEEVAITVEGEAEIRMQPVEYLRQIFKTRDTFRFKEELSLPSNKPNVARILQNTIQIRGVETKPLDGKIEVKGEAFLFLLYEGEEEDGRIQYLETAVSFQGEVPCDQCIEGMTTDISTEVLTAEYEVKPDYDGEMRSMLVELVLELDIRLFIEESTEILGDVYALSKNCIPKMQNTVFEKLLMKNASRCRISDRVTLEQPKGGILQICSCEGKVTLEKTEIVTDGIITEGTVSVLLLYITGDDDCPVGASKITLYFHHNIETAGIDHTCRFRINAELGQLSASMIDAAQAEIKATIHLNAIVYEENRVQTITEIQEQELNMDQIQERAGIIGYIAAAGDQLWNIAKENLTTVNRIMEVNHLNTPELREGDRILIIKDIP